ncbi:hypothetical protein [Streptomyces badius]
MTTQPERLHHLLDRARRGVILPAEGEALAELVAELEARIERVRNEHTPGHDWSWKSFGCTHKGQHKAQCVGCGACHPCPTLTALDTQTAP